MQAPSGASNRARRHIAAKIASAADKSLAIELQLFEALVEAAMKELVAVIAPDQEAMLIGLGYLD